MTMQIEPTDFAGVVVMRASIHRDVRGSFERIWSLPELEIASLGTPIVQTSLARNPLAGTLRGLHYAAAPHGECKYVSCLAGEIFDVLVDLRPAEPTFGQFISFNLHADDGITIRIPPGIAHGYQTLRDDSDVLYLIDREFEASAARTLLYSDQILAVPWPMPVSLISERDAAGHAMPQPWESCPP